MERRYKICDPVHGFIRFSEKEKRVIDSRPFQRLRYIRQMGVAYLVYPGAVHTRFEHSLGVMELAGRMYRSVQGQLDVDHAYWEQVVRLAALCHDMGHLPFSHTAEASLLPDGGHEEMTRQLIGCEELRAIWKEVGPRAAEDIERLAVSGGEDVLAQLITEDNFGADRIDYLIRDAYYTGVGYGKFDHHQLIDSLRVLEGKLGVAESGMQAVESLWISRYMMYARVYRHPSAHAYSKHMHRFMERHFESSRPYLEQTDFVVLAQMQKAALDGDEDAQVLLRQKPACVKGDGEQRLVKKGKREFPVLMERGGVVSSKAASPFLHEIPLGPHSSDQIESC